MSCVYTHISKLRRVLPICVGVGVILSYSFHPFWFLVSISKILFAGDLWLFWCPLVLVHKKPEPCNAVFCRSWKSMSYGVKTVLNPHQTQVKVRKEVSRLHYSKPGMLLGCCCTSMVI